MITIGISPDWDTQKGRINIPNDYITAVQRAGGLPLLFPLLDSEEAWKAMIDKVDGVIFSGGEDIDPKHFGEELHPDCGTIIPERDAQELFGYKYLLTTGKPFLAICRGIQLMNVAEGGTLYQDIPAQLPHITIRHSQPATADSAHQADILPGTLLHSLVGADRVPVNSRHHQVVKDVAPGLRVSALSEDGLVEGLEFENGYPGIGTQWHPENLSKRREDMQSLFNWLVAKAAGRA